jgi:UDP-glucose:(heptosyl)LPS alpha-1,3-glucosyltransferase
VKLAIVRQRYSVHGGAERFVARALQALSARRALDVTLLARDRPAGIDGAWRFEKVDPPYLGRVSRDRGFARAAQRRFGDFDLVQSHERVPGAAIFRAGDGIHAAWLEQESRLQGAGARALRALSPFHRYLLDAEKEMFQHPALRLVICNSKIVRDDIARRFGLPAERFELVYSGVDTAHFHPDVAALRAAERRALGIPAEAAVLAFVGSGFKRKGLATALAAIAPHPDVHLLVAGRDKHLARYRRRASPRAHFLEVVEDMRRVYGAADALLLPTLYDPFPNACVEAMACGLPVFTSPLCGAADWIVHGANGWVVDALDVDGYRRAIGEWLARRGEWPALRAAARGAAEPHTLAAMAAQLEALYTRLLSAPRR